MAVNRGLTDGLIDILRKHCLDLGCGGIRGLGLMFRHLDSDFSKRITYEELRDGVNVMGVRLPDDYIYKLFRAFDKDDNGGIDFGEFMDELRPTLSPSRIEVINEAFDKLDSNSDGVLRITDLKDDQYTQAGVT